MKTGCLILVDCGTTNTRVWLAQGDHVLAREQQMVGVRDTARTGSTQLLQDALRQLIERVRQHLPEAPPSCVIASGMITSPLGLVDLPHVNAPAGLAELAAALSWQDFKQICELPFCFIPGVSCGRSRVSGEEIDSCDVMRGEETLCVGLVELELLGPGKILLNLGSHWKAILLDDASRIAASVTTLTGELIHATQTQTVLAGSLPRQRSGDMELDWLQAGMQQQRSSGLSRALFCVRLLEQRVNCTAEQRFAFSVGAYLAADLDALVKRGLLSGRKVVLAGSASLARAWQFALQAVSPEVQILDEQQVERAQLRGMRRIVEAWDRAHPARPIQ